MYSIWAANNTDNAYTVHQAPLFFVIHMRHNKKEKKKKERKGRKKERTLMSDNKEALWTCLIIIKYHN